MKERFCDNFNCHRLATVFNLITFKAICLDCYLERFFNAPERAKVKGKMISSDLTTILQEAVNLLEIHRSTFEDEADNIGCDAGNSDGGSTQDCSHCQLIRAIEEIDQILNKSIV